MLICSHHLIFINISLLLRSSQFAGYVSKRSMVHICVLACQQCWYGVFVWALLSWYVCAYGSCQLWVLTKHMPCTIYIHHEYPHDSLLHEIESSNKTTSVCLIKVLGCNLGAIQAVVCYFSLVFSSSSSLAMVSMFALLYVNCVRYLVFDAQMYVFRYAFWTSSSIYLSIYLSHSHWTTDQINKQNACAFKCVQEFVSFSFFIRKFSLIVVVFRSFSNASTFY